MHFEKDYIFGVKNQDKIFPILKSYFGDDLKQTTGKYQKYDFQSPSVAIELKSRTCKYDLYPTTLLTCNKITNIDKKLIFVFSFIDSLYCIEYDEELFNTFQKKQYSRTGLSFDYKMYYFIPIDHLIKMNDQVVV